MLARPVALRIWGASRGDLARGCSQRAVARALGLGVCAMAGRVGGVCGGCLFAVGVGGFVVGGRQARLLVARRSAREELIHAADKTGARSEEHTSELQSLMRISYAVFFLKKKNTQH